MANLWSRNPESLSGNEKEISLVESRKRTLDAAMFYITLRESRLNQQLAPAVKYPEVTTAAEAYNQQTRDNNQQVYSEQAREAATTAEGVSVVIDSAGRFSQKSAASQQPASKLSPAQVLEAETGGYIGYEQSEAA